eukprot:280066-Pyramimonas_sp.AAC.1
MRDIVKSVLREVLAERDTLPATGASGSAAADPWQERDPWTRDPTTSQPAQPDKWWKDSTWDHDWDDAKHHNSSWQGGWWSGKGD